MELVEEKVDMSIYTNLSVCVWIHTCVNKPIFESALYFCKIIWEWGGRRGGEYEKRRRREKRVRRKEDMRRDGGGRRPKIRGKYN